MSPQLHRGMLLIVPAELDMTAHAGARGYRDRGGLYIADDDARCEHIELLGGIDVALKFAADHDHAGAHLAFEPGARINAEIAIDLDIAFEAAGDAHIAATDDLAFDGQFGSNDRFCTRRAARRGGVVSTAGAGSGAWSGVLPCNSVTVDGPPGGRVPLADGLGFEPVSFQSAMSGSSR